MEDGMMQFPQLPDIYVGLLAQFPPVEAYREIDGDSYLSIDYVKATADRVFGKGNWAINPDSRTLRFEDISNPLTGKTIGRFCLVEVTVLVRGCLPKTELGHALVNFGKERSELNEQQSLKSMTNAINNAIAIGAKRAFAQFGSAFQNKKEESLRQAHSEQQNSNGGSGIKVVKGRSETHPATLETIVSPNQLKSAVGNQKAEITPTPSKPYLELVRTPVIPEKDPWSSNSKSEVGSEQAAVIGSLAMLPSQEQLIVKLAQEKGYTIAGGVMKSRTFQSFGLYRFEDLSREQAELIIRLLKAAKPREVKAIAQAG